MTFGELKHIFAEKNVPDDVLLLSDSGWECDATDMDGVFFDREQNIVVFTQSDYPYKRSPGKWICLS